jgi:hypothetical protein
MAFLRFRRRIGILPGVKLNIGKRGASVSVGVRGAHMTFGPRSQTTVGLPGTGLSYTMPRRHPPTTRSGASRFIRALAHLAFWAFLLWLVVHLGT